MLAAKWSWAALLRVTPSGCLSRCLSMSRLSMLLALSASKQAKYDTRMSNRSQHLSQSLPCYLSQFSEYRTDHLPASELDVVRALLSLMAMRLQFCKRKARGRGVPRVSLILYVATPANVRVMYRLILSAASSCQCNAWQERVSRCFSLTFIRRLYSLTPDNRRLQTATNERRRRRGSNTPPQQNNEA